jgi:excisionase family DNA binding protein
MDERRSGPGGRRMSAPDLGAALLASLDDETIRALAERLRPYLDDGPDHRLLLTPAQAAERLRLHPKTVVRMARDGRLPAVKVGTGWRFHTDQLHPGPRPTFARETTGPRPACTKHEPASVAAIRGTLTRTAT